MLSFKEKHNHSAKEKYAGNSRADKKLGKNSKHFAMFHFEGAHP